MKAIKVSVIIVTYNGMQWIKSCLDSVLKSEFIVDIIVVDNESQDGTTEFIKENYASVKVLDTGCNLGFGGANNLGIIESLKNGADYIYLLNQDAYLDEDTIGCMVNVAQDHPQYGILSPMQYNGDGSFLDHGFKRILPNNYSHSSSRIIDVYFVMAAHWLISAACVNKVGLFDPIFYHYGEDNDYVNRMFYHGFKLGVVKGIKGYHDRYYRDMSRETAVIISYRSSLAILSNINYSFFRSSAIFLWKSIPRLIKSIIYLRFNETRIHISQLKTAIPSVETIMEARKRNKKKAEISNLYL